MATTIRIPLRWFFGLAAAAAIWASPAAADNDTAGRLEREAQQASNNGRYEEARQLRAIAGAIRGQDSVTSRQVQSEEGQRHYDRAKEILRIR